MIELFAQLKIHNRAGSSCVESNGFCPDWIAHNFGRYMTPLAQHVKLMLLAVAIGFVIAFGLGLLAYCRRWLVGPIT